MNILMVTNTYLPHVGGVAQSVSSFGQSLRGFGHDVLVVTSEFEGAPADEPCVIRVPAIEHFGNTGFSLPLPIRDIGERIEQFAPDVVHSHHPFLLGDTALRIGAARDLPVVFTHHTQYDKYAHYFAGELAVARHFIRELAIGYCNLCHFVVAPSQTIAELLADDGVVTAIEVIPTGIDAEWFTPCDRAAARRRLKIDDEVFVVGHVGRLAPEKNLGFLARAVGEFLSDYPQAYFLVAGAGPSEAEIQHALAECDVAERMLLQGRVGRDHVRDIYAAMDVFAFSSLSETQGIVLAEALASGVPVVALDAPGVRDVVRDGENGRLIPRTDVSLFRDALAWRLKQTPDERCSTSDAARFTAKDYSMSRCAEKLVRLYQRVIEEGIAHESYSYGSWMSAVRRAEEELQIWVNMAHAMGDALVDSVVVAEAAS